MKYRIGSFNWRTIGEGALNESSPKYKSFERIAEIIRKEELDIVAFQEVLSRGTPIEHLVKNSLTNWDKCWDKPEKQISEGYAFIWNRDKFQKAKTISSTRQWDYKPSIIEDKRFDILSRPPMYLRLIPVNGGFFEFRLLNVHLHSGNDSPFEINKRKQEYECLVKEIYPNISLLRIYGDYRPSYTIIMGDYNLSIREDINTKFLVEDEYELFSNSRRHSQKIKTLQSELTTLKKEEDGYSNNFDHFTVDIKRLNDLNESYSTERVDAVSKYYDGNYTEYRTSVSNHVPIILEISAGGVS